MTEFISDVLFNDRVGYAAWDIGHFREHQDFIQALAGQTPPVLLPDYDLMSLLAADKDSRRYQVDSHQATHALLSSLTGVSSPDFTGFDLDNDQDFYAFLGYHAQTHAQLRQALGVT
jgi:hypothetical protein